MAIRKISPLFMAMLIVSRPVGLGYEDNTSGLCWRRKRGSSLLSCAVLPGHLSRLCTTLPYRRPSCLASLRRPSVLPNPRRSCMARPASSPLDADPLSVPAQRTVYFPSRRDVLPCAISLSIRSSIRCLISLSLLVICCPRCRVLVLWIVSCTTLYCSASCSYPDQMVRNELSSHIIFADTRAQQDASRTFKTSRHLQVASKRQNVKDSKRLRRCEIRTKHQTHQDRKPEETQICKPTQ